MIANNFTPEGWVDKISVLQPDELTTCIRNNQTLQGIVDECDSNYNLHINLGNNIQGVMPREEVEGINLGIDGLPKTNLCTGKVHKYVQFKVKQVNDDNTVLLSRKDVQNEAMQWLKNDLKPGEIVTGIVKRMESYGVFIEIGGGLVGLAHIEDLSIARIKSPFERLKIGQKVNVMVKSINKEDGRVILSYKELLGTWEENADKFAVGQTTTGIVRETEKNKNGIFIELTPNLVGMAEYEDGLEYGQKVDVYIKRIDYERRKVKVLVV
ncbi:MAG: 30S ribosomal protein S1 [Clostridia bacterium]|nr:30S ribosomal protein S1 [Clostridia bacterium]